MTTNANPPAVKPAFLDPSPLGTKEYWDTLYAKDLQTRTSILPSHTGETWFDDCGAEQRIVDFLASLEELDPSRANVLDLGTGNASLLIELREAGFTGRLVGVDYSKESVKFAREVVRDWEEEERGQQQEEEGEKAPPPPIEILQHDILSAERPEWVPPEGGFDLVLDKGTFDAISLADTTLQQDDGRRPCEVYRERVEPLVKVGGLLLVTSCNWTEAELEQWMAGGALKVVGRVKYGKFVFGGKEGGVLSGLCWRREL